VTEKEEIKLLTLLDSGGTDCGQN